MASSATQHRLPPATVLSALWPPACSLYAHCHLRHPNENKRKVAGTDCQNCEPRAKFTQHSSSAACFMPGVKYLSLTLPRHLQWPQHQPPQESHPDTACLSCINSTCSVCCSVCSTQGSLGCDCRLPVDKQAVIHRRLATARRKHRGKRDAASNALHRLPCCGNRGAQHTAHSSAVAAAPMRL